MDTEVRAVRTVPDTGPRVAEVLAGIEVVEIGHGRDWYQLRSVALRPQVIAVTGAELRGFIAAIKAGELDELAGLHPAASAAS